MYTSTYIHGYMYAKIHTDIYRPACTFLYKPNTQTFTLHMSSSTPVIEPMTFTQDLVEALEGAFVDGQGAMIGQCRAAIDVAVKVRAQDLMQCVERAIHRHERARLIDGQAVTEEEEHSNVKCFHPRNPNNLRLKTFLEQTLGCMGGNLEQSWSNLGHVGANLKPSWAILASPVQMQLVTLPCPQ